jgi:hypothetical protein
MNIGDLVKITRHKAKGEVGVVLDYRHLGRFYPSIELTIKLASGETIRKDKEHVQKLGDNNDR